MSVTNLTTTEGNDQFYPTPPSVADKMLAGLDYHLIQDVLEPSAGKGDLAMALATAYYTHCSRGNSLHIDCCEIDPYLRQICKYNFSDEKKQEIYAKYREIDDLSYSSRTEEERMTYNRYKREHDIIGHTELYIVNDDFFTYHTHKHYNLILMNPPFENGDLHLLRALEMQKNGGKVICLLNAETLRNPYTATRRLLMKKLQALEADIEYVENAFSSDAERKADVDVAIVKVNIPEPKFESTFYERMKEAADKEIESDPEIHALVSGDYIEQAVQMYKVEVDATMELVKEYMSLVPYMYTDLSDEKYKSPILTLVVANDSTYHGFDYSKYMKLVRVKYWRALFTNKQFTGKLTSELREKYYRQVENMANYEFSIFNIKQVLTDMNASICSGVEKAIMDLFEKLTIEHSWYPECAQNKHYFNGWRTNSAHKIGKKCIIPTSGMFSSYSWSHETFDVSTAYHIISDIEKAFDYLDGGRTQDGFDLDCQLKIANSTGKTKNIPGKYFTIDLFKKGTTHIKFLPEAMPLVERLNIYASQKKAWLPPNYGKTKYSDLGDEEKATVDSFHGDGSSGSGEKKYTEVISQAAFYLSEPTQTIAALAAPSEN